MWQAQWSLRVTTTSHPTLGGYEIPSLPPRQGLSCELNSSNIAGYFLEEGHWQKIHPYLLKFLFIWIAVMHVLLLPPWSAGDTSDALMVSPSLLNEKVT
ncbi:hypothetical protein DUNSADRAFT_9781 [Dunaliella salina]|uniref:Uncharacterized protein n=1 Tax=Dunaliella salina TaxID=3046 RepID=A0ABQ7GGR7_DUNSA|nr:hypothetical protein DUNSADRAFT_9781 [Dunaliella salina]|eukprot:KAF5833795.1 hypothetical protein DUNSADRAFT_9781 [Dunaliella salina]